ncbi:MULTISPECIES: glycoside hydrolase family 55 protein [unclassified Exiguobacterium]|uniref:glycoside hydrolase family 55 protein n=1 Tax=unclassified Exiguobacterium TaxID=2644629 RepID=UPI00103A3A6C|nr:MULTISPECIES: glycoside hydrolase family 55 protein [unclassified Exiguobacterium]TCI44278.1 pectate lyase [Exiguobacterium sp. SH5S32]TCI50543.1 pectate lyase [Exiguobacterium sp. SH1S4]TCI69502.1 pectate lyase [Exiguobacterium sp. SH1S1]
MMNQIDRTHIAATIARHAAWSTDELLTETLAWHQATRHDHYPDQSKSYRSHLPMTERITPVTSALPLEVVDDLVRPVWMRRLDAEHLNLLQTTRHHVDVTDYGAVGDGKTDCTLAFRLALRSNRHVHVPAGVYIVRGVRIPSNCVLEGAGQQDTVLRLADGIPKHRRLLRNATPFYGNHHIEVAHLTLDWNVERLGDVDRTSSGDTASSALTFAHVKFGWVHHVTAKGAGLHAFDITAPHYHYLGDGLRAKKGSRYIWLDRCEATNYGDDGITTHHSDAIYITNCYCHHPHGRTHAHGFSNSNGIEVDDGSRHVVLVNNMTEGCFGGVEVKAHGTSSAAHDVHIFGHVSYRDNRSFNFRHIGHHLADDPESKTARFISGTNLLSIEPVRSKLYAKSSPRSLVISAYQDVLIHGFTAIGDPSYDYTGHPALAVQYKSRNVQLKRIATSGFVSSRADIELFGGDNRTDHVTIEDVTCRNSAPISVKIGGQLANVVLKHIEGEQKSGDVLISTSSPVEAHDLFAYGFSDRVRSDA